MGKGCCRHKYYLNGCLQAHRDMILQCYYCEQMLFQFKLFQMDVIWYGEVLITTSNVFCDTVVSPYYKETSNKGHLSYQASFQMHSKNKILLTYPLQEAISVKSISFHCRWPCKRRTLYNYAGDVLYTVECHSVKVKGSSYFY